MLIKKFLIALLIMPVMAWAWEPTRPITVLIGFQPGSGNEVGFRVLAKQVQLAEARPDGHTISIPSYMGTYITNDIWQRDIKKWQYNTITSVMGMGKSPMAIVANANSKINTPQELNALLRNTTHPITFAVGAGAHRMTWEFIMDKSRGNRDLVKYAQHQGPLQAVTAVASDSGMEFGIMPVAIAKPLLDAGRVKLIGISGDKRVAGLDAEPYRVGGQYINVFAAWSLALPPGTPADIVDWYQRQFAAAIKTAEVQQFYRDNYIFVEPAELTPRGLAQHIEHLRSIWMPVGDQIILAEKKQ
jgi:tripartite-type tricarboxylate transporter receptor subunit TctC